MIERKELFPVAIRWWHAGVNNNNWHYCHLNQNPWMPHAEVQVLHAEIYVKVEARDND